jgi:hypothetical protein
VDISNGTARRAVDRLGEGWSNGPVSAATDGVRGSVGGGLTFFSRMLHVGITTPLEGRRRWVGTIGFGPRY